MCLCSEQTAGTILPHIRATIIGNKEEKTLEGKTTNSLRLHFFFFSWINCHNVGLYIERKEGGGGGGG